MLNPIRRHNNNDIIIQHNDIGFIKRETQIHVFRSSPHTQYDTIRLHYINMCSKAEVSEFTLAHGKTSTKGTMDPEGARLLTYSTIMPTVSPACRPCINIHHYAPPHIVLQHAAATGAALHALHRQCSSEGSMSSLKSIT